MQLIAINAKWVPDENVMLVTLNMGDQYFEDRLDRAAWDDYISRIDDDPFRICGQQLIIKMGDDHLDVEMVDDSMVVDKLKMYLKAVDRALRVRGDTKMLPEF